MRSSGVHHVDLAVSSVERSLPFYRDLLGPLGFHRIAEVEGERGETIWTFGGPGSSLGLRQAQSLGGVDRYRGEQENAITPDHLRGICVSCNCPTS